MKTNLFTKSLMTVVISAMMVGCSQEDVLNNNQELAQGKELKIVVNDLGFTNEDPASRVSEDLENYITKFENGDAIGIYVIGENSVILKNVKAEKNETGWSVNGLYHYEDADYIAYFPYDEALITADIKSEADIVTYFDAKFTENQTSEASYYACDLMMAKVEAKDVKESITFNFSHTRSMLEFVIPTYMYKTSDDVNAYTYSIPLGLTLTIGDTEYQPRLMEGCKYRCIVKPSTDDAKINISGRFTDAQQNKPVTFAKNDITLAANGCITYKVNYEDAPETSVQTRPIAVGDYYYSDGNIYPGDFPAPPTAGCLGVIFSTTTNSELALDGTTCSHGYVLSLYNATGNTNGSFGAWNYKLWQTDPGSLNSLGLTETAHTDGNAVDNGIAADKKGWEYTKTIVDEITAEINGKNYYLKQALESYGAAGNSTEQVAAPKFTSGWFVPSVGHFMDLVKNLGKESNFNGASISGSTAFVNIDAYFGKLGLKFDNGTYKYWSTNTSLDNSDMKAYYLELSNSNCQIKTDNATTGNYRIRPILAF